VVTAPNGTSMAGLEDFTATRFPQLVQRSKLFYEGPADGRRADVGNLRLRRLRQRHELCRLRRRGHRRRRVLHHPLQRRPRRQPGLRDKIDANGVRRKQYRDVRSQITTVNEFNNGGSAVYHTSYAYDPVRQITDFTDDQGNVISVSYDLFGRRTGINSPDAGLTTFTFDLADNLIAKQTANLRTASQQVTFGYQFNRVTAITYPNFPVNNVTYTYGAASQRNPSLIGNVVGRDRPGDPGDPDPGGPGQHLCDQAPVRHLEPRQHHGLSGPAGRRDRDLLL
jgi:YD repeat-containing protein